MPELTIVATAGRNKHGQRLSRVKCGCGNEFICREDSVKQGRTKSCGCTRVGGRKAKPVEKPTPVSTAEITSAFERGTPQWFDEQISRLEQTAIACEKRRDILAAQLAEQPDTDLDTHKKWNTEATNARKMRQEIARLQMAKSKAETSVKKDTRTQAEINREKIAALKGTQ